jgi:hypothetical protein
MKTKLEVIHCFASVCIYYLRIESNGGLLWERKGAFSFHRMSVSWPLERLLKLWNFALVHVVLSEVCHDEHDVWREWDKHVFAQNSVGTTCESYWWRALLAGTVILNHVPEKM